MRNYSFDINKSIKQLMPYFLVKPIHYAWLKTLLASIKNRYADFLAYRQLQLANATINSSVNRLTQALWDNFDPTNSIYLLQNTDYQSEAFIYLERDGVTHEFDYLEVEDHDPKDFDHLETELNTEVNFFVRIPIALQSKTADIDAFVKKYVYSGITFSIETF